MRIGIGIGIGHAQRVVGGGLDPADLFTAGVQGFDFNLSEMATLFQDSAGTIPVTAAGQPLARINDRSPNGNNLILQNAVFQIDGAGLGYAAFNGTSTTGATAAVDLSTTNKISLFAGVRKATDGSAGSIVESSASPSTTAGTFSFISSSSGTTSYGFRSFGSNLGGASSVATSLPYSAPHLAVLAGSGDIATDANLIQVNDAAPVSKSDVDLGAGNYGNHVVNVGARGGSSLWFNGRIYSLTCIGKVLSAGEFSGMRATTNARTGA